MTVTLSTVSTLFDLAVDFLAACDDALATTERGAPAMTYISPGTPVYDYTCDTLAVYVQSLTEESTAPLNPPTSTGWRHRRGRINLAAFTMVSARCGILGVSPTANQLTAAAKVNYEDGWAVWNVVTQKIKDGSLFDGPCTDVHFDNGLSLTPQAGLMIWQFTVRAEIGGYPAP